MGDTTRAAGGLPCQFMDDRVMVLFGLDVVPFEANHQALRAAAQLDRRLAALGVQLDRELGCETDHVIHLHTGRAAVGETGDRLMRTLTAVGSAIDVVRQLAAKEEACAAQRGAAQEEGRIVVSRPVWTAAQRPLRPLAWQELELPGGMRIEIARIDAACVARPDR